MSGVVFGLQYWNPGSDITGTVDITDSYISNSYDLQSLSDGYYRLTEYTPALGYKVIPSITFTIKNGLITLDAPPVDEQSRPMAIISEYDNKLMLAVFNEPVSVLPDAGGKGTIPFTIGGLAIIIAGVWIILYDTKRRKKFLQS